MNKRGISLALNVLIYLLIGIVILILGLVLYTTLTGNSIGAIDFLKNIFRFR